MITTAKEAREKTNKVNGPYRRQTIMQMINDHVNSGLFELILPAFRIDRSDRGALISFGFKLKIQNDCNGKETICTVSWN